jgi:PilZ domain
MYRMAPAARPETSMPGRKEERFEAELIVKLEGGEGVARNVSASGIYFLTDVALEVGQPVKLTLEFENVATGPIAVNCIAHIVRVEQRGPMSGVAASISSFEFRRVVDPGKNAH